MREASPGLGLSTRVRGEPHGPRGRVWGTGLCGAGPQHGARSRAGQDRERLVPARGLGSGGGLAGARPPPRDELRQHGCLSRVYPKLLRTETTSRTSPVMPGSGASQFG